MERLGVQQGAELLLEVKSLPNSISHCTGKHSYTKYKNPSQNIVTALPIQNRFHSWCLISSFGCTLSKAIENTCSVFPAARLSPCLDHTDVESFGPGSYLDSKKTFYKLPNSSSWVFSCRLHGGVIVSAPATSQSTQKHTCHKELVTSYQTFPLPASSFPPSAAHFLIQPGSYLANGIPFGGTHTQSEARHVCPVTQALEKHP